MLSSFLLKEFPIVITRLIAFKAALSGLKTKKKNKQKKKRGHHDSKTFTLKNKHHSAHKLISHEDFGISKPDVLKIKGTGFDKEESLTTKNCYMNNEVIRQYWS